MSKVFHTIPSALQTSLSCYISDISRSCSVGVFKNFEKDGEFFCFVGQSTQAVTGMYNLNRASQIAFQGEDVLHRARIFSYEFLRQREAQGMLRDKWIIEKDLAGEVIQTILHLMILDRLKHE